MYRRLATTRGSFAAAWGLLGIVLLLTGCGGGDTTTSAAPPTKAEFVRTANAICVKAEAERGIALKTSPLEPLKKQLTVAEENEVVLDAALPPVRKMVEELSELTPPAGEEQTVTALLKELEAAVRRSEKEPQAAMSGVAFVKADKEVKAFGLAPSCSI